MSGTKEGCEAAPVSVTHVPDEDAKSASGAVAATESLTWPAAAATSAKEEFQSSTATALHHNQSSATDTFLDSSSTSKGDESCVPPTDPSCPQEIGLAFDPSGSSRREAHAQLHSSTSIPAASRRAALAAFSIHKPSLASQQQAAQPQERAATKHERCKQLSSQSEGQLVVPPTRGAAASPAETSHPAAVGMSTASFLRLGQRRSVDSHHLPQRAPSVPSGYVLPSYVKRPLPNSRLGPTSRCSFDQPISESTCIDSSISIASTSYSAGTATPGRLSLPTLHKALERLMMSDSETFRKVTGSLQGINSLSKETNELEMGRDSTGVTTMNQYIVVKTLGRGSFGKVKLCLNTMDGRVYAVKMVHRSFIIKQLQKPQRGLRRRVPPKTSSTTSVSEATDASGDSASSHLPRLIEQHLREAGSPVGKACQSPMSTGAVGNPLDDVMREIAVLKKLDHPNVVRLYEVIDPPDGSHIMMVMEYMEHGPVLETKGQMGFNRFPEAVALDLFRQVCMGLDYLHFNGVVHGDLKPENLLLSTDSVLKIADFGSSRVISDPRASSKISGTPAFQAPEAIPGGFSGDWDLSRSGGALSVPTSCNVQAPQLQLSYPYSTIESQLALHSGAKHSHHFAGDVWALGVCLYCFMYGRLPFLGSCVLDINNSILNNEVKFPSDIVVSPLLKDLFFRMFIKNPTKRITLEGVMEHPWTSMENTAPLATMRSLHAELPAGMMSVSNEEESSAVACPSLVSLIRAKLKEKTYADGTYLFHEADEAHSIFLIMSGVVELLTFQDPNDPLKENAFEGFKNGSLTVDIDDSLNLECQIEIGVSNSPTVNGDGTLHIDQTKTKELMSRMSNSLFKTTSEYVLEVKGPGQIIGGMSLGNDTARFKESARAKGPVTLVILNEGNFIATLLQMYGGDSTEINNMGGLTQESASMLVMHGIEGGSEIMSGASTVDGSAYGPAHTHCSAPTHG